MKMKMKMQMKMGLSISLVFIMALSVPAFAEQNDSMTMLEAIKKKDVTTFSTLIDRKDIDVNIRDEEGNTPLHWAAKMRLNEVVKPLLERKADPNLLIPEKNVSPLGIAVFHGNREMVALLLDAGAKVNVHNFQGRTALITAASMGHHEIAVMLLEHGAEINATNDKGSTALMIAASSGHVKTVEVLLAWKADPSVRNKEGKTAVELANDKKKTDVVKVLREHSGTKK